LFITKSKHQLYSVLSISIKIVAIVVCNFTECFYIDKYRKMVDGAQAVHTVYEMHVRKSGKGNSFSGNGAAHPTPDWRKPRLAIFQRHSRSSARRDYDW